MFKIYKIHDKDWMVDLTNKVANLTSNDFKNGKGFINFNINYHFADFEDKEESHWQKLFGTMLEVYIIIFYLIGICLVEVNVTDVIYSVYFSWYILPTPHPFCMFI